MQRAYKDKHSKLPLEDGVDVISVGTAFKRFLEVGAHLRLDVHAVIDNDGNISTLKDRFDEYVNGTHKTIRIWYDDDESHPTLEPQLLKANSLDDLNAILGTTHGDNAALLKYMGANKTDCALKMFKTDKTWVTPDYIANAIE